MHTLDRLCGWLAGHRYDLLVFVLLAAFSEAPLLAAERWRVTGVDGARSAQVDNDAGFVFSVSAGPSRAAHCELRLPPDIAPPQDDSLPTLGVDGAEPHAVLRRPRSATDGGPPDKGSERTWTEKKPVSDEGDLVELASRSWGGLPLVAADGASLRFECWAPLAGQDSPTFGLLRQILDGEHLVATIAPAEEGEEQTSFSLDGAPEAITEALGISTEVSSRDLLQEELLEFRVHYRKTTCYVLAGRKRRQRCLEAVNRCALQAHDSVLSMQECIDGR